MKSKKQKYKPLSSATPEEMQEAFLKLIASDYASSSDSQLRKETDVERIKTVIGLK